MTGDQLRCTKMNNSSQEGLQRNQTLVIYVAVWGPGWHANMFSMQLKGFVKGVVHQGNQKAPEK